MLKTGTCRVCGHPFTWNHVRAKPRTLCDQHQFVSPRKKKQKPPPGPVNDPTAAKPVLTADEIMKRRRDRGRASMLASERPKGIDPATCDVDYDAQDTEFIVAVDRYKRERRRPFPTLKEYLAILRTLGYRKVATA